MEDESTDSGRDNRSRTVASNPGWDDDGLLEEIVGGSIVASARGGGALLLALHVSLLLLEEGYQLARLVLSLLQATTLMTLLGAPVR